jgi:ABC-type transport system involved in multi-copper enzyme maturation permease subunit
LVWMVILNFIPIMTLYVSPALDPESASDAVGFLEPYLRIFGGWTTFGVIVLTMDTIVEEKRRGTAAWVMSNPVSRTSFILSKLIANVIGILVIVIGLQGLLVFLLFYVKGEIEHGALAYLGGMGLNTLNVLFYITLSIMLGCFFSSRGPVIGISIAVMIGQDFLNQVIAPYIPWLHEWLPNRLGWMAGSVGVGEGVEFPNAILSAAILSALFVLIGIWKFSREEL